MDLNEIVFNLNDENKEQIKTLRVRKKSSFFFKIFFCFNFVYLFILIFLENHHAILLHLRKLVSTRFQTRRPDYKKPFDRQRKRIASFPGSVFSLYKFRHRQCSIPPAKTFIVSRNRRKL